jgi:hypothetical protein
MTPDLNGAFRLRPHERELHAGADREGEAACVALDMFGPNVAKGSAEAEEAQPHAVIGASAVRASVRSVRRRSSLVLQNHRGRRIHPMSEWIGGSTIMPMYLSAEGTAPYKPELFVWIDVTGALLGAKFFRPEETAPQLAQFLLDTTYAPLTGGSHIPERVRVASEPLAAALRAKLDAGFEVVCGPTPEIEGMLQRFIDQIDDASRSQHETYLASGISEAELAAFFHSAARLWRSQTANALPHHMAPCRVTSEELDLHDAVLTFAGANDEPDVTLCLFPDILAYEYDAMVLEMIERAPEEAEKLPPAPRLLMRLTDASDLHPALVEEITSRGWEIAAPSAYPEMATVGEDRIPRLPSARELRVLGAVAAAFADMLATTWADGKARTFRVDDASITMRFALVEPKAPSS